MSAHVDMMLAGDTSIAAKVTDRPLLTVDATAPTEAAPLLIEHEPAPASLAVAKTESTVPAEATVPAGGDVQEQARQAYRDSVTAGTPLNGKQLGALFDRSERWGRVRIAEAKPTLPRAARRRVAGRKTARAATAPAARAAAARPATGSTNRTPGGSANGTPDGGSDGSAAGPLGGSADGTPAGTAPAATAGSPAAAAEPADRQPPSPASAVRPARRRQARGRDTRRPWALLVLAAPAFVAIWSGWVGLGEMTGFGLVHPLPGIADGFAINSAITLPIGVEAYAAYAMRGWLAQIGSRRAQRFARASAIGALILGGLGQVAYHLMSAAGISRAPWPITTFVACLPVVVLGFGAGLAHLQHHTAMTETIPDGEETV